MDTTEQLTLSLLFNIALVCAIQYYHVRRDFDLKLNVLQLKEKTTRPFRYDLNQIPYDYTVEVTNRFK